MSSAVPLFAPQNRVLLDATNGHKWLRQMESLFHTTGLHRWIDGTNPSPARTPSMTPEQQQALNFWIDMNSRANGLIDQCLSPLFQHKRYFSFESTAYVNFRVLKKFIQTQALSHESVLRNKLEQLSMNSSETITDFYNRWLAQHDLYMAASGKEFSNLRQVECFIKSVRDPFYDPVLAQFSYEPFIMDALDPSESIPNEDQR